MTMVSVNFWGVIGSKAEEDSWEEDFTIISSLLVILYNEPFPLLSLSLPLSLRLSPSLPFSISLSSNLIDEIIFRRSLGSFTI